MRENVKKEAKLKEYFEGQCQKFNLNAEDYKETFCQRLGKTITTEEDVIVYVKGCKLREDKANKPQKSQADRLVEIGLRNYLFLDQHGREYARVVLPRINNDDNGTNASAYSTKLTNGEEDSGKEGINNGVIGVSDVNQTRLVTMPLHGSQFKKFLAEKMYNAEQKVPSPSALHSAITVLSGIAQKRGTQLTLYNRMAPDPNGNGLWIDMADENWRAIHVTAEGWNIVDEPPILFRRYKHQKPLAVPVHVSQTEAAKTALRFLEFVNIKGETNQLIFLCVVTSYLVSEITHPALTLSGPQGSAKTWLFRFVKKLVDPSKHETLSLALNEIALVQQLDHSYLAFYDNISHLKNWQSDSLCRAISGGGFSKRELYTDDEDVIYNFKRCVGLNGINVAAQSGDLLDRIILFILESIRDEERRTEKELKSKFEKERPLILGAILSILSKALKIYTNVKLQGHKRLADFHRWGCAIAQALGYTAEDFEHAYSVKVELQNEEALSASSVATALIMYCKEEVECSKDEDGIYCVVEKTPTELFDEVTKFADRKGIKTSKGYWPGSPSHFTGEINKVKTNLEKVGLHIIDHHDGSQRLIIIDATELKYRRGLDVW